MGSNDDANRVAGALTFPSREEAAQPVPVQPRQPRNLQGLLRFAMEATKAEDAPGNSILGPMDEERRKFLEEALNSMTVNIAEVLQKSIKVLTNSERVHSVRAGEPMPEDLSAAFNQIHEFIDDIDIANDFYKMGGFAIFAICFGAENAEVRAAAAHTLAELCQNNPFCQARALECGLVNILINLLETEQGNALKKCIYALSCAIREYPAAAREAAAQRAGPALLRALADADAAVRVKAAFLVRYLVQFADIREQLVSAGAVDACIQQVTSGLNSSIEVYLSILCVFLAGGGGGAADPGLRTALHACLADPDKDLEEKEISRKLLNMLQKEQAEEVDR